eukprot:801980-Prorocentrum_minimum.AAC.1
MRQCYYCGEQARPYVCKNVREDEDRCAAAGINQRGSSAHYSVAAGSLQWCSAHYSVAAGSLQWCSVHYSVAGGACLPGTPP